MSEANVTVPIAMLRRALEALEDCHPSRESFDFGPAYEIATREHGRAIQDLRSVLRRNSGEKQ